MAPKTSLFPRLRPNFQEIEREKIQAEEARLRQIKTMGDLEFTADMQPQFVGQMTQKQKDYIGGDNPEKSEYRKIFTYLDDPIAQYGFDPDRIRFEEPSKNTSYFEELRDDYPKNETNAYYAAGEVHTDQGSESDVIKYGVKLGSSKEIIAHEARHRGFQLLRNMQLEGSKEDQEAWVKKYGKDAAWLLNLYFSDRDDREFTNEAINELRDRVDTTFNPPKFDAQGNPAGMGAFSGGNFNAGVRNVFLEDLRKSKKSGTIEATQFKDQDDNPVIGLDNSQINRAFRGLDQAAKDAMKKQKDDYRKKMTVRSQEGKRKFAQGGVAMKDQMEMSFALGGVAETVDPVSGNDVPPGSLPVEVRDDIPARLSEGEYVVPADVVRFFGVKFFEDIRMQAKMGLQQMEEDGRIGGEPVEMASADVDIDSLIDAEMSSMNEGGLMSGYANAGDVRSRGGNFGYGYGYTPKVKDIVPAIQTVKDLPPIVDPTLSSSSSNVSAGFTGVRIFYNAQGQQVSVQFVNNQPQQSLEGLSERNPLDEGPEQVDPKESSKKQEIELKGRAKQVSELNFKDPDKVKAWATGLNKRDVLSNEDTLGRTMLTTAADIFTGGIGGKIIGAIDRANNTASIRAAAIVAEERGFESLAKTLFEQAGGRGKKIATGKNYAQDIRDAAVQITSGPELPYIDDPALLGLSEEKTSVKEGLKRIDFADGTKGDEAWQKSLSATETATKKASADATARGTRVDDAGESYKLPAYYRTPTTIRPTLRPRKNLDAPYTGTTVNGESGGSSSDSSVTTDGYVTGAVDRNGNRVKDGSGIKVPEPTYTPAQPKKNSYQDNINTGKGNEGGDGGKSIVCTEMYRQTQLADWSKAMKTWDIYQKKYLTPAHEIGYHWLFRPYVRGMQKNNTLTRLGAYLATERTQHLRHILTKGKAKDSLVGKVWCSIIHPVVYAAGKIKGET